MTRSAPPIPVPEIGGTGVPPRLGDAPAGPLPIPQPDVDKRWTDSRFWLLQVIILALYLTRLAVSVALHLDPSSPAVELSTVIIFLIPVMYAALSYGVAGAIVTATWVTVLAIPRVVTYLDDGNSLGAWVEVMQVAVLILIAVVVGHRVSAERTARRVAQAAEQAHLRAEALYRNLFDSNQAPILITDTDGRVVEANTSAYRVFPQCARVGVVDSEAQTGRPRLVDVIGPEVAGQILTQLVSVRSTNGSAEPSPAGPPPVTPVGVMVDGEWTLFRPTSAILEGIDGVRGMQVTFNDVTAETRRHDRLEAFTGQVVLGQEEERRHLAQELHDGPVQTLIHLCRLIDDIERTTDHGRNEPLALSDLRAIAEGAVADLRGIAKGLRPSILDDLGLVASISQLLAEVERRNPMETSLEVDGVERRLAPSVELALFRVTQEALSNVERHATARRVDVGLDFAAAGMHLLIRDDGVGAPPEVVASGAVLESMGLPGMAERARLIGGTFSIRSGDGPGTTVEVWVPHDAVPYG